MVTRNFLLMQPGLWGHTRGTDPGGDLGGDQGWDDDNYGDEFNGTTPSGGPGGWCTPPPDDHPHPDILAAATLNLCAGPGGWETGATLLPIDLNIIGVDTSKDACATAEAAGYKRVNTSIRVLHPAQYPNLTGLISSTPCPTMSASGLRSSVKTADYQIALDSITSFGTGCGCDWQSLPERSTDVRTALAVETARWALMLPNLRWLVAEQVPAAECLFEDIAAELFASGWESVNVDTVEAADFGAAARRKRTFLVANRNGPVHIPSTGLHPPAPVTSLAAALGWPAGQRVRTRNNRKPTGGNLFSADGLSWCLTASTRTWERDADRLRFTPAENGLLQGFPAAYPWQGSRTSQFKQSGDVVAPPVAAAVLAGALNLPHTVWDPAVRQHMTGLYRTT